MSRKVADTALNTADVDTTKLKKRRNENVSEICKCILECSKRRDKQKRI